MITTTFLGGPAADNAVMVLFEAQRERLRFLFDCGQGVLDMVAPAAILDIDHLLFSHLHMDHVAGFDHFFRINFARPRANEIWGPPETARIIQHRLQGFMWNHADTLGSVWHVHDIGSEDIRTTAFAGKQAFGIGRPQPGGACDRSRRRGADADAILRGEHFTLEAITLDHATPSLGYVLREHQRWLVDTDALARFPHQPGPWMQQLKRAATGAVTIDGTEYDIRELRQALLIPAQPESVAFLTDFRLNAAARRLLAPRLAGVRLLVTECQYSDADHALAEANHHSAVSEVASLARDAGVAELRLLHVSRRYGNDDLRAMLAVARSMFANSHFPDHWGINS